MAWLLWPVSVAVMSRIGRYLLYEVAVLARIAGRYDPCWALFAVWRGCFGPLSLAVMTRVGYYLPYGVAVAARVGGRNEPCWPLLAARSGWSGPYRWPV